MFVPRVGETPVLHHPKAVEGFTPPSKNDSRPLPIDGASDATNEGLAEELLKKLKKETSQRRNNRQRTAGKVRCSTWYIGWKHHSELPSIPRSHTIESA